MWAKIAIAIAAFALAGEPDRVEPPAATKAPRIEWRQSTAVGVPESGRLVGGVRLPAEGRAYFTWDPVLKRRPDRDWRRWNTDELVRTTLEIVREFRRRHPAPNLPLTGPAGVVTPLVNHDNHLHARIAP